jgi:hypothetical protein
MPGAKVHYAVRISVSPVTRPSLVLYESEQPPALQVGAASGFAPRRAMSPAGPAHCLDELVRWVPASEEISAR